jgi:gluconolactonase
VVAVAAVVEVFSSDGAPSGVIPVPRTPANVAFAGADGRTLYITAESGLYRVTVVNPGRY